MNIARHLARLFLLLLAPAIPAHAGILQRGKVQLICHRTANRDMPENTLESLALAARMGCNIVEVDIRKTADGQLVLNHDDFDRAEWALVKAGTSVLPQLRQALPLSDPPSQARIIRILGWQGDHESLPLLRKLQESGPQNKVLIAWAIEKIEVLRFQPWTN